MDILVIFVWLVLIYALVNIFHGIYIVAVSRYTDVIEPFRKGRTHCGAPDSGTSYDSFLKKKVPNGWDGNCHQAFSGGKFADDVKLCGGKPKKGELASDCRRRWLVDSSGQVCSIDKMDYAEKHGKCPKTGSGKKSSKPKPHQKPTTGRRVPDDSQGHRYKKFVPDDLDELPISRKLYEEMGRDFMKDEAKNRGITAPPIHDSEAEIIGRMVWRVYVAEIEQKRVNSPKATDEVVEREIQLLDKVSKIIKTETDHHRGKKHQPLCTQAAKVPQCSPQQFTHRRTTNMYGYRPPSSNHIKREPGHAFEGHPLRGVPRYYDSANAVEHCQQDRACGGVNFDSTTGEYTLMPLHARIVKKSHYTAFIKTGHKRPVDPSHRRKKEQKSAPSPYLPVTGIGFSGGSSTYAATHPRNPNLKPRPYNSIMNLFP